MAERSTVLETSIGPNRDQDADVRLIKASLSSLEDVQTLQKLGCIDHAPVAGSEFLVLSIGESWKLAIQITDGVDPAAAAGEKWLYSQDVDGNVKTTLRLKNDGTMELNGSDDFAVAFTDLKTVIDTILAETQSNFGLIATAITSLGGSYTPAAYSPATDITPAKVATVKLP